MGKLAKKPTKGDKKPKEGFFGKPKKGKGPKKSDEGEATEGTFGVADLGNMDKELEKLRGVLSDKEIESMKAEFKKLEESAKELENLGKSFEGPKEEGEGKGDFDFDSLFEDMPEFDFSDFDFGEKDGEGKPEGEKPEGEGKPQEAPEFLAKFY